MMILGRSTCVVSYSPSSLLQAPFGVEKVLTNFANLLFWGLWSCIGDVSGNYSRAALHCLRQVLHRVGQLLVATCFFF